MPLELFSMADVRTYGDDIFWKRPWMKPLMVILDTEKRHIRYCISLYPRDAHGQRSSRALIGKLPRSGGKCG